MGTKRYSLTVLSSHSWGSRGQSDNSLYKKSMDSINGPKLKPCAFILCQSNRLASIKHMSKR